jgi:hypothetical protein
VGERGTPYDRLAGSADRYEPERQLPPEIGTLAPAPFPVPCCPMDGDPHHIMCPDHGAFAKHAKDQPLPAAPTTTHPEETP